MLLVEQTALLFEFELLWRSSEERVDFGYFRTKVAIAVLRLRVSSRCLRAASPSANASRRSLQQARIAQPRHAATPTCLGTTAGSPRQHRRSLTPPRPLKLTALGHRSLADANQPGATAHSRFRRRANCQTVRSTTVVRNTPRGHTRGQFIFHPPTIPRQILQVQELT